MDELITLINENDEAIGFENKLTTHELGKLHRDFSLFIIDESEQSSLIQKRAIGKYHSGGLWTNTYCSHPRKGEELLDAVCRRVKDELGISVPDSAYERKNLWECKKFTYRKDYGKYIEYEIEHVVLIGMIIIF